MFTPQDLKELRAFLKISSADLAARLGVRHQTVVRWECGIRHPREEHLEALNGITIEAIRHGYRPRIMREMLAAAS